MTLRYLLPIFASLLTSTLFSQISATHSSLGNINLCESQTTSITFSSMAGFGIDDTLFITFQDELGVTFDNFTTSTGAITMFTDTIAIHGISSSPVIFNYTTIIGCDAFDVNSTSHSNSIEYVLNSSGLWSSSSSNLYTISSPVLNFIGGAQLAVSNGLLNVGVEQCFYFTNSNNSRPFNGIIEFCDTLSHPFSNSAIALDTVYLSSPNGVVLNYEITDSTLRITIDVNNLQQNEVLEICTITHLFDCVLGSNNQSNYRLNYGCDVGDLCQTVQPNGQSFITSMNYDPNDVPNLIVLSSDTHHEGCYFDTVIRTEMYENNGTGNATGIQFQLHDYQNQFGITFLDTALLKVYLNSISPANALNRSISLYVPGPNESIFSVVVNETIGVNDTVILQYREINKCINENEYIDYTNHTISTHDIFIRTSLLHPCLAIPYTDGGNLATHNYRLGQQFNNLIGTMGDFEEKWFEINNVGDLFAGNGLSGVQMGGIAYDLTNSRLEVELLLESGLSLTSPDSLQFCSTFAGITSFLPLEGLQIFYGPPGTNQFDTIRALFNFPTTFQAPNTIINSTTPVEHYPFKKTSEYYQFFSNSSIKFKARAYCDSVALDSKAIIHENVYFIIEPNCVGCKLSLASVEDEINILCPGCILPGWNLTDFDIGRTNLGYVDVNNDHFPDAFPLQDLATNSEPQNKRVMIGDTLEFALEGFITDGDPNTGFTFNTLGVLFDEGQVLFKGDVSKLQFIGGSGTFTQGSISSTFTIPVGSEDVFPTAIGIDMSIASLNSYGITNISNYNDSCSIVFKPKFRVIDNFDDGLGANPYIDLKNVTAFYFMGGTTFGAPDLLVDANTTPIASIASMSAAERENLSYWCVGYDGRFVGVGIDFKVDDPQFTKYDYASNSNFNDCAYSMIEFINGFVGDEIITGGSTMNTANGSVSQNSAQAFDLELRDLYNLDSLTFYYPIELEPYEISLYSSSHFLNLLNFQSAWSPYDVITPATALFSTTDTSITIYPELFQHQNTNYTLGDNFGTYDENIYLQPRLYLRQKSCYNSDLIPIMFPFIENHFSNFPGATNGDTTIVVQMGSNNSSTGVGDNAAIDLPNPIFNLSANQLSPQINSNLGFEINLSVVQQYPPITALIDSRNDVAYNTFLHIASPNGNLSSITIPSVDLISTNFANNASTTSTGAPLYSGTLNGNPLIGLGTTGGATHLSHQIDLFANYNCSTIPPGGQDSLYLIYGWNCFEYPDTLQEACFLDTFVLYIDLPDVGLDVDFGVQDSISLCDTLNFWAEFDATGFGDVNNLTVEIMHPDNASTDYLLGSGLLNYDGQDYPLDPIITDTSYRWVLDSLTLALQDFDELSPPATFFANLITNCGITNDTLFIRMSGTNFCNQIIFEDVFSWTPHEYIDLPTVDSLGVMASIDPFVTCTDTNSLTLLVSNLGNSASDVYNEIQLIIPADYEYVSGGSPIYNSNDTLILAIGSSIAAGNFYTIDLEIARIDTSCTEQFLTAQLILRAPYYCDTNECFYTEIQSTDIALPFEFNPNGFVISEIDPALICSGVNELFIEYSAVNAGTLEVYDANSLIYLGQLNYSGTNGTLNQSTVLLSDSSSNLFFVNVSPCCSDTIYYAFNCDTICQADASFSVTNYCLGDTILVESTSLLGTHQWTYSYFGLMASGSSASFPAAQAGTFSITHIFAADCGQNDTITHVFTVYNPIQSSIVLIGTNPICQPDSVELTLQNGMSYSDFLWTTGETTPSIWVSSTGTYGVTVVDQNGCSNDCQAITVTSSASPILINDTIYSCSPTDTLQLDAGVYPSITWNNGTSGQYNTVVGSGVYTAVVCENFGLCCATFTYTVLPSDFMFDIPDTVTCNADSTLISVGFLASNYAWSNGDIGLSTYYLEDGIHWMTATNAFGCTYTDSFAISSALYPISDFTVDDTICTSDSITCLFPEIDDTTFAHHWIFDLGGFEYHNFDSAPCFNFDNLGTFPITHIVSNDCGSDTTIQWISVVEFNVSSCITIIGQNPFCIGDSVQLTSSSNYVSIEWYDGFGYFLGNGDTLTVFTGGIYAATVTDSNGCVSTCICTELSSVEPYTVDIPDTVICNGGDFLVSLPIGVIGVWSDGSTGNSILVNSGGSYWVDVENGPCSYRDSFTVVESNFNVNTWFKQKKCQYAIYATNLVGYSYEWYYNGSLYSSNSSFIFDVAAQLPFLFTPFYQDFIVIVTDQYGCQFTDTLTILLKPCKVIGIFPNPVQNGLTTINYSFPDAQEVRFELTTLKGALLGSYMMSEVVGNYTLDVKNLTDGMYLLKVFIDGEQIENLKLMKTD